MTFVLSKVRNLLGCESWTLAKGQLSSAGGVGGFKDKESACGVLQV